MTRRAKPKPPSLTRVLLRWWPVKDRKQLVALLALIDRCDSAGETFIGLRRLAAESRMSVPTLRVVLASLAKDRWITVETRRGCGPEGREGNRYAVNLAALRACVPTAAETDSDPDEGDEALSEPGEVVKNAFTFETGECANFEPGMCKFDTGDVQTAFTEGLREGLSEDSAAASSASPPPPPRARGAGGGGDDAATFLRRVVQTVMAAGLAPDAKLSNWWAGPAAVSHVNRWLTDFGLTPEQVLDAVFFEQVRIGGEAPRGPKAFDAAVERAAKASASGGEHREPSDSETGVSFLQRLTEARARRAALNP